MALPKPYTPDFHETVIGSYVTQCYCVEEVEDLVGVPWDVVHVDLRDGDRIEAHVIDSSYPGGAQQVGGFALRDRYPHGVRMAVWGYRHEPSDEEATLVVDASWTLEHGKAVDRRGLVPDREPWPAPAVRW